MVAFWPGEKEPEYNGKKLSEWLEIYGRATEGPARKHEAVVAVEGIGTNAIPFLLKWIDYSPPAWRTWPLRVTRRSPLLRGWWLKHFAFGGAGFRRSRNGHFGFAILGPAGESALPELTRRLNETKSSLRSYDAMCAMRSIGGAALRPVFGVITNRALPSELRYDAVMALMDRPGVPDLKAPDETKDAVSALMSALEDPEPAMRMIVTNVLQKIAPEVLTNGVTGERE